MNPGQRVSVNSGPRSKGFRSVRNRFSSSCGRRGLLLERLTRLRRQPEFEYFPRRYRVITSDHHGVPEYLLEQVGLLVAGRGRAGEQPPDEPARPVDADEPDQPQA